MLKLVCFVAIACLGLMSCSGDTEGLSTRSSSSAQDMHPGAPLVKANCMACHKPGLNGAPIIGNIKMWGPRITQGKEVLIQHAITGYGLMPPRGGSSLSDVEMAQAVDFMLSQLPPGS